jgi:hypothetical protein
LRNSTPKEKAQVVEITEDEIEEFVENMAKSNNLEKLKQDSARSSQN